MSGYGQFARVMAGVWLLFQIIILLDFIYDVNEWLLKKVSLLFRASHKTVGDAQNKLLDHHPAAIL